MKYKNIKEKDRVFNKFISLPSDKRMDYLNKRFKSTWSITMQIADKMLILDFLKSYIEEFESFLEKREIEPCEAEDIILQFTKLTYKDT